jgi:MFS-type transporter involved in bile tolerance (Atg22 family)
MKILNTRLTLYIVALVLSGIIAYKDYREAFFTFWFLIYMILMSTEVLAEKTLGILCLIISKILKFFNK